MMALDIAEAMFYRKTGVPLDYNQLPSQFLWPLSHENGPTYTV